MRDPEPGATTHWIWATRPQDLSPPAPPSSNPENRAQRAGTGACPYRALSPEAVSCRQQARPSSMPPIVGEGPRLRGPEPASAGEGPCPPPTLRSQGPNPGHAESAPGSAPPVFFDLRPPMPRSETRREPSRGIGSRKSEMKRRPDQGPLSRRGISDKQTSRPWKPVRGSHRPRKHSPRSARAEGMRRQNAEQGSPATTSASSTSAKPPSTAPPSGTSSAAPAHEP